MNLETLILLNLYSNDIFVYVGTGSDAVWSHRGNICGRVVKQVRGLHGIMGSHSAPMGYGESNANLTNGDLILNY